MKKLLSIFLAVLVFAYNSNAQNRTITGRVTNKENAPLEGVSVSTSNGSTGTQTEKDGTYSLSVASNVRSLVFSFVNFETLTRNIGNASTINVTLSSKDTKLDEVVVVGYGVQQKKAFTGSASRVETKEFANLMTASIDKQLAGRATGVQVTNSSGLVNQPARIRIRGIQSITGVSDPLIVVDGIPIISGNLASTTNSNALGDINPADIENIEVLKDGSSTAIYGSRAAGGVILITTKKGTRGKSRLTYDGYVGFASAMKKFDLLDAKEFVTIANEKLLNAGGAPRAFMDASNTNTDWQSVALNNNAPILNQGISLQGGGDKTTYYLSLNYSSQKGVIVSNYNKAYRIRLNLEHEVNRFVKIGNNITLSRQEDGDQNNGNNALSGAIASALRLPPNMSPYSTTHLSGYNINYPNANSMNPGANLQSVDDNYTNVAFTVNVNKYYSDKYRIINNTFLELSLAKGLKFRSQFSPDMLNDYSFQSWDPRHGDGYGTFAGGTNGLVYNADQVFFRYTFQNYFNYSLSVNNNHNFYLTAGHELSKQKTKFLSAQATNIADLFFIKENIVTGSGAVQTIGGGTTRSGFESMFGRLNYDFKNKFFLQASLRRDAQSSIAPDKRYGTFPGFSVGWRPSEESFWKNSALGRFAKELKLKASYATVGNTIGGFPYLTLFSAAPYGNIGGVALSQVGGNIRWETSKKYDLGIEASVWKNRIRIAADYFLNDVDDLVLNVPTPPSAGVPGNAIAQNIGKLKNRGIEISVGGTIVSTKDFSWDMNVNYSKVKNKITSLYPINGKPVEYIQNGAYNLIRVGDPINIIHGYRYAGVNSSNGNPMYYKANGRLVQHNIANGTFYYANSLNDPSLGETTTLGFDDRVNLGQATPTWFGAINNTFTYKGFSLDVMLRYSGGNKIMNITRQEALFSQSFHNNGRDILNRWTTPGQVTDVPKLYYGQSNAVNQVGLATSRFVECGDYLRLQNVVLSYTVDSKNLQERTRNFIQGLRFFVQGQNLAVWTKYKGVDPDNITVQGLDQATSPQVRVVSTGVSVTF